MERFLDSQSRQNLQNLIEQGHNETTIKKKIDVLDRILKVPPANRHDLIQRYHMITERIELRKLILSNRGKVI